MSRNVLHKLGVTNAHRLLLHEGARWTQASLTKALNGGDEALLRKCITRHATLVTQKGGERPTTLKGADAFVSHFATEKGEWAEMGMRNLKFTFSDLICVSEGENVVVDAQFFLISPPAGGLYGGVVQTGRVEDVYIPDPEYFESATKMRLHTRHILLGSDPAVPPTSSSA